MFGRRADEPKPCNNAARFAQPPTPNSGRMGLPCSFLALAVGPIGGRHAPAELTPRLQRGKAGRQPRIRGDSAG